MVLANFGKLATGENIQVPKYDFIKAVNFFHTDIENLSTEAEIASRSANKQSNEKESSSESVSVTIPKNYSEHSRRSTNS